MASYLYVFCFMLFWMIGKMACVEKRNFYRNNLTEVPSIPAQIPNNTEELSLHDNRLSAVSSDDFEGLDKLYYLGLDYNFLTFFPNLSSIAKTLRTLQINNNQLSMIPAQHLDILIKLEHLHIYNNFLTTIPNVAGPSNSLICISAGYNKFKHFPKLQKLGKSLELLFLRGNKITEINAADLICGTQISEIQLTNNPLVCDKHIAWMLTDRIYTSGTCDSPHNLKGTSVYSLSLSKLGITEGEFLWYNIPCCKFK